MAFKLFHKIGSKNYWISCIVIVIAIMLLEGTISNFITKYVELPAFLLSFLAILIILTIVRLLSEEILEIN